MIYVFYSYYEDELFYHQIMKIMQIFMLFNVIMMKKMQKYFVIDHLM